MQADLDGNLAKARIGLAAAALILAAASGPATAEATLVVPHSATHSITVHAAPTASAPNSAPVPSPTPPPAAVAPSLPPSLPSANPVKGGGHSDGVPESEIPGAGIPGSAPYPEGLPNHWEDGCDLSCKQEWLDYYEDRVSVVWQEYQATGSPDEKSASELLNQEVRAIEDGITAAGGTPGEDPGGSSDGGVVNDSGSEAGGASSGQPGPPDFSVPDAISGASPIVTDVLGVWDGTWITEALGAGIWEALTETLWNADVGPCPKGSYQRTDKQVTDPNGAGNPCF